MGGVNACILGFDDCHDVYESEESRWGWIKGHAFSDYMAVALSVYCSRRPSTSSFFHTLGRRCSSMLWTSRQ